MGMIFIPGMRPGNVSGAAGRSRRSRGETLTFGGAYRGKATPKNLVPFEMPRGDGGKREREAKDQRARDVAQAFEMAKHQPNTVRERLRDARAAAETVAV